MPESRSLRTLLDKTRSPDHGTRKCGKNDSYSCEGRERIVAMSCLDLKGKQEVKGTTGT